MGPSHPMIALEMMRLTGGKERTEQEFATLLRSAGLTLEAGHAHKRQLLRWWSKRRPPEGPLGNSIQA